MPRPISSSTIRLRDVAVFNLAGPDGAAQICAALVLEPFGDPQAIRAAAAARLGAQAPTRLFALEALPRNASGKLLKRTLREPYWAGYDRRVN